MCGASFGFLYITKQTQPSVNKFELFRIKIHFTGQNLRKRQYSVANIMICFEFLTSVFYWATDVSSVVRFVSSVVLR